MESRLLGTNFEVSSIGLGCMGMSEFYGRRNDVESMKVLRRAVEMGVDFFDTADMYGPHHNEELIGQFLKNNKIKVKVATKFGIVRIPGEYNRNIDNSEQYTRLACEASLKRLGIEQIDLYFVHRVDKSKPIEETIQVLQKLKEEGKISRIGLCEVSSDTLRRAHKISPITAVQSEYSLWERGVEHDILPACRELGVGFVAYSPLGRGFLTGDYRQHNQLDQNDFRAKLPRFSEGAIEKNLALADAVVELARTKGCTPAQLSLAWLLAQGSDIVPIPGTKSVNYLEENVKSVDLALTLHELQQIESQLEKLPIIGERYTEEGMKGVNA
jgi:aryl-alcohol dehydrogenase-like predicted oxidoreductase